MYTTLNNDLPSAQKYLSLNNPAKIAEQAWKEDKRKCVDIFLNIILLNDSPRFKTQSSQYMNSLFSLSDGFFNFLLSQAKQKKLKKEELNIFNRARNCGYEGEHCLKKGRATLLAQTAKSAPPPAPKIVPQPPEKKAPIQENKPPKPPESKKEETPKQQPAPQNPPLEPLKQAKPAESKKEENPERPPGPQILFLESLDLKSLKQAKHAESKEGIRDVYYDEKNGLFLKIWSPNFEDGAQFQKAYDRHFFDTLAPITHIIKDKNGKVRGYSQPKMNVSDLGLKLVKNKHGYPIMAPISQQNKEFQDFVKNLMEISKKTNSFFVDFTPSNVAKKDDKYCLIDLESVFSKGKVQVFHKDQKGRFIDMLEYTPEDYRGFILQAAQTK